MDPVQETVTITVEKVEQIAPKEEKRLSRRMGDILEMIEVPETPVSEINRVIAGEIAAATGEIASLEQSSGYKLKFLMEQVKALRELSKTLSEAEVLSKKDILNFDGPKFQYVYQELIGIFKKSIKDAGMTEDQANTVLRNFRDMMAQKEPELRKSTEKIDSSFIKR